MIDWREKMKVVAITGPSQCELVDRPEPVIRGEYVKVKIEAAPMCTEFKAFKDGHGSEVIGHEAAGEVVEVSAPGRVRVGDRVVLMPLYPCGKCELCLSGDYIYCEHKVDPHAICESPTGAATYAQYALKQDWLLLPIPEEMSYQHASMACCGLGPTFGAMQNMRVDAFDTVLIVGLGPVGLGGVINAAYRGARVIGVETNPYRARLAMELGASAVVNPEDPDALAQIRALTGGRGVDKAIDCTAVPAAQQFAIQATRVRGHVSFVGWGGHIDMGNMVPGGLTLQGAWHWNYNDAPRIMQVIRSSQSSIDRLITHTFPMSRVKEAWELQLSGQCGKVLLNPWE
jgi:L-iditol 2-dehydrogenase